MPKQKTNLKQVVTEKKPCRRSTPIPSPPLSRLNTQKTKVGYKVAKKKKKKRKIILKYNSFLPFRDSFSSHAYDQTCGTTPSTPPHRFPLIFPVFRQQCCRACRSLQAWGSWPRHRSRRTQQAVRRRRVRCTTPVWRTVRAWRRVCRHRRRLVLAQVCTVRPGQSVLLLGARRGASRCRWDVLRRSAGMGGRAMRLPDMHCACRRGGSPHRRHRRRQLLAATS